MPRTIGGRHVLGAMSVAFGLIVALWQNGPLFVYPGAAAQVAGGVAIQFARTARAGALILGVVYLVLALVCVPRIFNSPLIYDAWGNFFEPFSLATGAAIVYARFSSVWSSNAARRLGRILMGICVVSFTLEQAFYLHATAELVPAWLPPSQMFWAVTTTVLFGLAAIALLANWMALLAARLLTIMLVGFGLIVWVRLLIAHQPASYGVWSETIETFAIAGAVWILAELLAEGTTA